MSPLEHFQNVQQVRRLSPESNRLIDTCYFGQHNRDLIAREQNPVSIRCVSLTENHGCFPHKSPTLGTRSSVVSGRASPGRLPPDPVPDF